MNVNMMAIDPTRKKNASNHKKKRSITINTVLEEKLRDMQSQLISSSKASWSLSGTVNVLIMTGLLALDKLSREDFQKIKNFIESGKVTLDNKTIRDYVSRVIKD